MNWNDNKLEITVVGLTIFAILGVYGLGGRLNIRSVTSADINYTMPRPPSANYDVFSLDGREVNRSSIANQGKTKKKETLAATAAKAKDAKKAAAKPAVAQKPAAKAAPKVSVNVIDKVESRIGGSSASSAAANYANANNMVSALAAAKAAELNEKTKDEETLSEAQWKTLIYAQPTKENFSKLIAAVQNNKVSNAFAYGLMEELFKTRQQQTQSNIIAVLGQANSGMAFTFAVKMSPDAQGQVAEELSAYIATHAQKEKFVALNQVLAQRQDADSVSKALEIISETISKASTVETAARDGRSSDAGLKIKDFALFTGSLSTLAKSQAGEISTMASEILNHIQPEAKVASLSGQTL